jgi:hypothetical protein
MAYGRKINGFDDLIDMLKDEINTHKKLRNNESRGFWSRIRSLII